MLSILYIDDEISLLEIGKIYLEQDGLFSLDTASSASAALALLNSKDYDAIISDYQMPEMDGIELLKKVRGSGNNIPFILFTGRGREEVVIQALNEGADFYLQKGGDSKSLFAELSHKIRQATQKRQAESALEVSEQRYRAVVEDQTELICRFTSDGRLTFVNDAYCRYFCLEKERCLGKPHTIRLPPEDALRMKQHLTSLTRENPVAHIEHRIWMPDDTIRWQRWNDRAIFDNKGKVVEYQSVGRDITRWKDAEEKLHQNYDELMRYQKTLHESEERYRTVFEHTGTATVLIEKDAVIRIANGEFSHLSGYSKQEIEGRKRWTEFVVREDLDRMLMQHRLRREHAETALNHYEFRFITKTAEIRTIFSTVGMIPGTTRSVASLLDITERKRAEENLQALHDLSGAVLAACTLSEALSLCLDTAIRLAHVDSGGIYIVNPETRDLDIVVSSGLSPDFVVDVSHIPAGSGSAQIVYAKKSVYADYPYLGITSNPVREREGLHSIAIIPILYHDGVIACLNIASHTLDTLPQESRNILDMIASTIGNAIGRILSEEALRESEADFRAIFNNAGDAIIIHDLQGRFLDVNDEICRRLQYSREELLKMHPEDLDEPEYGREVKDRISTLQQTGHIVFETTHCRKDGTCIPTEVNSTLITFHGEPAILSSGRDITERKQAEDALRRTNRQLTTMTGITRHDIRNQILTLLGYLELAKMKSTDPELDELIRKQESASQAIQSQIEFTKLYQEMGNAEPRWLDVGALLSRQKVPVTVTLVSDVDGVEVFADAMLEKVFANLFDNSLRHGSQVTEIRISSYLRSGKDLTLLVEDNGVGIPAEEKEHIFERGFGKNTGLGLFLVREILDITGMTIIETGEPGNGARFEIIVPDRTWRFAETK